MIDIKHFACDIIDYINSFGAEAYLVGGAIRDYFLSIYPSDFDLLVKLNNNSIEIIFKNYKIKRLKENLYGVVYNNKYYEISICENIEKNLLDRDFTINSIAYSNYKGFIDPLHGIDDLKNRIIKSNDLTFNNLERNKIRILRAIRFEASKGLTLDSSLLSYIVNYNDGFIDSIKPKFSLELNKILLLNKPSSIIEKYKNIFFSLISGLKETYGFLQHNPYHSYDVFKHTMIVLDSTMNSLPLRIAALYHDLGKPLTFSMDSNSIGHFYNHFIESEKIARKDLELFNYPKSLINRVCNLVLYHDFQINGKKDNMISFLKTFGDKDLDLYFNLKKADILGQNIEKIDRLSNIDGYYFLALKLLYTKEFITRKELKVNESELLNYGYSDLESKLNQIYNLVLDGRLKNNKSEITKFLEKDK